MPPANSPNHFISALRGLESPVDDDVLNLAATLTTTDAADSNDSNVTHASIAADTHANNTANTLASTLADIDANRSRLQRSMDRLNRLHDASPAQYGARVPSQNTMYDWSPLPAAELDHTGDGDGDDDDARSLRALQARLRLSSADSLRSTAILQSVRRHPRFSARSRDYLLRHGDTTIHSTRDRDTTTNTRDDTRDATTRDATTREVTTRESRDAARAAARYTASLRRSTHDPWAPPRERYQATQPPPQPPPAVAPMLEHTVQYLSRIRHATSVDESLNCALEAGFLSKDYFCIQYADFLTDTHRIPPPQHTSWLAPGAVLSGCQHATTTPTPPSLSTAHLPPPSRPWLSTTYSTPRSLTSYLSPNPPARTDAPRTEAHQDRWPVKVTIHAVDWSEMSLSATMEAYNVPSHPHQHSLSNPPYTRTSSITTYLEGEILDFNTHSLLTESFKSSAANDALYWRKLPPFKDMQDEEVVRALTSRRWWDTLSRDWILMRWKERCFVKSLRGAKSSVQPSPAPIVDSFLSSAEPEREYYTYDSHTFARHAVSSSPEPPNWPRNSDAEHAAFDDSGCGLTISGFYFVCLRRADGRVDGLYYDPMSSPYQCLELESAGTGRFGSWEFA